MNYNTVFAPIAAAERSIKAHAANLPTYLLIVAVVILSAAKTVLDFIATHAERVPEYHLMLQLAKVRTYRCAVLLTIKVETVRLQMASKFTATMDKIFCLQ